MEDKDIAANVISIGGMVMTIANFQIVLTLAVLTTALVLNIVRIWTTWKDRK